MSVAASTVPTVKAYLFTRLQSVLTAASSKTLEVQYSEGDPTDTDDVATISTGRRVVEPLAITGDMSSPSMMETYELLVAVSAYRPEGFQVAEERAWALLALVESVVRADMWGIIAAGTAVANLGGQVFNLHIGDHETTAQWSGSADEGGALVTITYPITVHARI